MTDIGKNIKDDTKIINGHFVESDIQRFYANKTIFITGCTGYMGKCLVEKLLRGCPDVKHIYLMVRAKRRVPAEERIKNFFDDVLFSIMKEMYPEVTSKVSLIEGDLMQEGMALSEKARNTIIEEVNIMFHNASNVKFFERMNIALKINVLGTKAMLDLAKQCKRIEGFLYVSTAFSHCYKKTIMEQTYPAPADLKMVHDIIAADLASPAGLNNTVLKDLLAEYPNTYVFTKATAESLVNDFSKHVLFPCVIYRPAIVISSYKEPLRSWCGNMNGPGFIFIGYALGLVHAGCVPDVAMDFVPVDMSINSLLVSMWDAEKRRRNESGAFVYNYSSSYINPLSIMGIRAMCAQDLIDYPSIRMVWKDFVIRTECIWYFAILHVLFHLVPALIFDFISLIRGKKMRAVSAFRKVTQTLSITSYFTKGGWTIDMTKTHEAIDRMSRIDCELFSCDIRKLDWKDYLSEYWIGLRTYILQDPMSTVPAAKRKYRILNLIHYILKYTFMLLFAYVTLRLIGLL